MRSASEAPAVTELAWTCPAPLRDYPNVVLGHGGGGRLSRDLVEHIFVPAFRNEALDVLGDAAVVPPPGGRLALSTDSYVVHPLVFPGGSIGELAVHGTVNDLAMSGAVPLWLTAGFILEEGLPMEVLADLVERMAAAARAAGVRVVTGDTKVVEAGHGHGCYVTTAGVGRVPDGVEIGPDRARPGDAIVVSGSLGDHGMAVMSVREGLEFGTTIESDTAPLAAMVADLVAALGDRLHCLRDPTRGGLAASLEEIGGSSGVGFELREDALPVRGEVRAACELLGLDPLFVANEGKLVAIVEGGAADLALETMRAHAEGREAAVVGTALDEHPGVVTMVTTLGARRVVPAQIGEQLPRIC